MGAKKIEIAANWYTRKSKGSRILHKIETTKARTIEDLPQTLNATEATAHFRNCHPKTIERMWRKKELRSFMLNGERVTTPEYIGEYYLAQMKNG